MVSSKIGTHVYDRHYGWLWMTLHDGRWGTGVWLMVAQGWIQAWQELVNLVMVSYGVSRKQKWKNCSV